ncbi:MFS transporter, OPA family, glycerol-3-phosphate transporter/MFS transporter, OPA family, sugar phosphate sensor protein UhpC [Mariniphaga anaerophila]|uniref:MFS transporter, OPA family, glycerol-3-phosphate transporter/MFS transporter, OPA family, sugar phosphate sensor protein UhpC n=1 Tax=Mariniphaga anaerophila TaxID=1484053 RepID=A0A1M4V7P8_9BACT|nr:MFS transporter [Mariniphaga anaerophila]SHE64878.1 MFS transporter, OPA family, glycerol-3-phosphate transporter/MFS transporter, OPA family, sugar phosphate sensor protein UhpC [Mariniphaga anaerophila]
MTNILSFLKPAPEREQTITDQSELKSKYKYWRTRVLYTTMIGYVMFYFVRKNISIAMPAIEADLGISKADLGLFLTLHGVVYGISKFVNGFFGDQTNPRYFMALGLFLSASMSLLFGLSSGVLAFGIFWLLNGWFQGMGFPPCANSLTNWFSPSERGVKFAMWNTSHSIGAALVLLLNSFLVVYDWRYCFIVPAALAFVGVLFILNRHRDNPESLGLPPVEVYKNEKAEVSVEEEEEKGDFKRFVRKHVFGNPAIWFLCLANFFLYTIRYAILDWGPTFLTEMKGVDLQKAGWLVAGYEGFGILGMLSSGWMMDKVFKGRGGRAALIYMAICSVAVFFFWKLPNESPFFYGILLCVVGFFIYGPQALVGIIAANLATKKAAATAIGLTGLFAYLSTVLSGWGLGYLVTHHGWSLGFLLLVISGVAATVFFAFTWNSGYIEEKTA